jgi:hypothetical protein
MTTYGSSVLRALERGPMTAREIALDADITVGIAYRYATFQLRRKPQVMHIYDWEVSEADGLLVPIYKLGPGKSITAQQYRAKHVCQALTNVTRVLVALKKKPMTTKKLIEVTGIKPNTCKATITTLRGRKEVRIAYYEPGCDKWPWVPVYALGKIDAKKPQLLKEAA